MKVFYLFLGALPFLLPLNFYPEADFPKSYLALLWAVLAFCGILLRRTRALHMPKFLPWLVMGLGLLWLSPLLFGNHHSDYHVLVYSLALVLIVFSAFVGASVSCSDGRMEFSVKLAAFFVVSGGLLAIISLLRYYGLLTVVIPGIAVGGSRMIGPLGQPNLVALFFALSISGLAFLWLKGRVSLLLTCLGVCFLIFSGALTGSRYFYVSLLALLSIWLLHIFIWSPADVPSVRKRILISVSSVILTVLVSFWIAPAVDKLFYTVVKEAGLIDRISAEEMMSARLRYTDESRASEFKKVFSNAHMVSNFMLGSGVGAYPSFSYQAELLSEGLGNQRLWTHPHNLFLMFFVESGVLGVIFLLISVAYFLRLIFYNRTSTEGVFLASVLVVIFGHNLIEFSLWSWPFLVAFFVVAGALDKSVSWKFSDRVAPALSVVLILSVFSVLSVYFIKDYATMTRLFQAQELSGDDEHALFDATRNSILGKGAMSVRILRFEPAPAGLERQAMEIGHFARIWPSQLFLARQAVIQAGLGKEELACAQIESTLSVYPDGLNIVHRDLELLAERNDEIDMGRYEECILRGMSVWISGP